MIEVNELTKVFRKPIRGEGLSGIPSEILDIAVFLLPHRLKTSFKNQ